MATATSCSTCPCTLNRNEVVALLGRNGAGKSTTLKTLMGLVRPRSGQDRARRHTDARPAAACDRCARPAAGAGGAPHLRQPERRGEPRSCRTFGEITLAAGAGLGRRFRACANADAAAAPICRAASSRCWRSRARWCASRRSCLLDEPFEGLAPIIVRDLLGHLPHARRSRPDDSDRRAEHHGGAEPRRSRVHHQQRPHRRCAARRRSLREQPEVLHGHLGV